MEQLYRKGSGGLVRYGSMAHGLDTCGTVASKQASLNQHVDSYSSEREAR